MNKEFDIVMGTLVFLLCASIISYETYKSNKNSKCYTQYEKTWPDSKMKSYCEKLGWDVRK